MQLILSPNQAQFVREKVEHGEYGSVAEVVQEALELLQDRDQLERLRLEELRKEIAIGIEQADRGEVAPLDIETIKARVRTRLQAERDEQS